MVQYIINELPESSLNEGTGFALLPKYASKTVRSKPLDKHKALSLLNKTPMC